MARAEWIKEKPKLEEAQAARGFKHVPAEDEEYVRIINDARLRLAPHEAPAMPCLPLGCYAGGDPSFSARGEKSHRRPHQDHTAPKGYASVIQFALVHTPIQIGKAMRIPDAKKAVDDEWSGHERKYTEREQSTPQS